MTWLDSIARLLDAVVWPVALLLVVWWLREPLAELIQGLKRFRSRWFDAEFGRRLQEMETKADRAQLPGFEEEANPERLAAISPRAAITEAWRNVEIALREQARQRGYPEGENVWRVSERLAEEGVISPSTRDLLSDMRHLRNEAVHADEIALNSAEALEYSDLAERIRNSVLHPST